MTRVAGQLADWICGEGPGDGEGGGREGEGREDRRRVEGKGRGWGVRVGADKRIAGGIFSATSTIIENNMN